MRDADLTPTGRELRDPSATLIECVDEKGLKHTVISFDEEYRGHVALTTGVDLIMSFMAYPMVTGLVECNAADTGRARFAYPTGTIWTAKEVMRGFDQVGQTVGPRAALEICYLGGMILHEAGETGPLQGCFSHGNLSPWRLGFKADGQLQIFGYGLAQVEMYEFVKGAAEHIDNDAIRYAPPERLEGQPEQPSSDTYSLAVIAHELITGKPLFDQDDGKTMWESVKMAEGVQRMLDAKGIPKPVRELLSSAMIYDPDTRLSGMQFVDAVGNLLDNPKIEGRTLSDVMTRMGNKKKRSSRKLVNVKGTATAAFKPADLKALAEAEDDLDDEDLEDESESGEEKRWGSVTREGTTGRGRGSRRRTRSRGDDPPKKEDDPKGKGAAKKADKEDADEPRRRRRRKKKDPEEAEAVAEPSRRRRRKRKDDDSSDSDETSEETSTADDGSDDTSTESEEDAPRRRRRRRSKSDEAAETDDADDADDGDSAEKAEDEDASPPRRRRRRRSKKDDEPSDEESVSDANDAKADESADAAEKTAEADEEPATPRRRRRRSTTGDDDSDSKPDEAADGADGANDNGNDAEDDSNASDEEEAASPRRRRRRRTAAPEEAEALPTPRRRRRRSKDDSDDSEDSAAKDDSNTKDDHDAKDDPPAPPRRRRRKKKKKK